jgi:hypothetical protein
MLCRLRLVTAVAVVPIEDFNPLLESGVLSMGKDWLDGFFFAGCLPGRNDRLLFRL